MLTVLIKINEPSMLCLIKMVNTFIFLVVITLADVQDLVNW